MQPIIINFEEGLEFDFYNIPVEPGERMIAMPAFLLNWFKRKAKGEAVVNFISDALTGYFSAQTLGGAGLAAKGVPRVLLSTWNYLVKFEAAFSILLINDQIKAKIVSSGSIVDGKTQGQKFLEIYYEASLLFSYVGKPTIENILSHDLDNMLKDFTTLKSLWDALTVSGAFDSVSEEDKKELSELIVEINNILEDDEVVK